MINIQDKAKCCGCTACASICPLNCIDMKKDFEGFFYPHVDTKKCNDCGLCQKICPIETPISTSKHQRDTFAVRSKDMDNVLKSTSGGFFIPMAAWMHEHDGVICAASYDAEFNVKHTFIEKSNVTVDRLSKTRGSKYVQSELGDAFSKIKELLKEDRLVCFVGTPCQVSGLKKYLRKNYENLITVDLVCRGTPSPKLWKKYVDYQEKKHHSKIKTVSFRNKTYGYHNSTMNIVFENGKIYNGSARVDYMLKSFMSELASRPSCYQCAFKSIERCSDLTIYDCWHFEELVPNAKDDNKGYTNVIAHSDKGKEILTQLQEKLWIYPVDTNTAVALDGIMINNCAKAHARRNEFYKDLDNRSLDAHIQEFIPINVKNRLFERAKIVLYKLGLLNKLKKMRKK